MLNAPKETGLHMKLFPPVQEPLMNQYPFLQACYIFLFPFCFSTGLLSLL